MRAIFIRVFLCAALCTVMPAATKKVISPPGARIVGPYSPGILAGGFLYVSGQGAKGPDGKLPESPHDQVKQCLENIKTIAEAAGLRMQDLVYAQVYVVDTRTYAEIDKVWAEYFGDHGPARAILGVARLPDDTPIEINAVAAVESSREVRLSRGSGSAAPQAPDAVLTGEMLYVSGIPAANPKDSLSRMGEVLRAAGMDFANMVFVQPYMTGAITYEEMNHAYAPFFEFGNTPARATIQVVGPGPMQFTGVAVKDLAKRRAVRPKNMEPSRTASPCVFAGDIYYCSAKSAFIPGPNSGVYASSVEEQVRMSFRNLLDGLEEAGLKLSDVVAANVYLDDIADFAKMNSVYQTYFPDAPPARTTIQQIPPVADRKPSERGHWPALEQISFIAVR